MAIFGVIMAAFVAIVILPLLFWRLWFLRNPYRNIPKEKGIVSPADGKISRIIKGNSATKTIKKGLLGRIQTIAKEVSDEYYLINIVMTPLNVHYQRAPIDGHVLKTRHKKGRFSNAMSGNIAIDNENNEILIKGDIKVKVVQIAGALARRIHCYVKKNQKIEKGQLIGLINLGSQVTLIIPSKIKLSVRKGQKVTAGETIIGK